MKSLVMSQIANVNLSVLGLLIFFVYFCGVVYWTTRKDNQKRYEQIQNLPFEDGDQL